MADGTEHSRSQRLQDAAWPDMFANLQSAYAELTRAQFDLEQQTAEIEEARDLFQRVIESMSEALFLLDRGGRVIRLNPAAALLLDYEEQEILGQPFTDICGNEEIPATPWALLERAPSGVLTNLDVDVRTRSGDTIPVSLSCGLVRDKRSKITGVLAVARDMRETRRLIASLQAALQTREQFLTIASHELKTPLAVLQGYTQLLQRALDQGSLEPIRVRRALVNVEAATRRLIGLVGELLDVSRLQAGRLELQCKPMDLVAMVEESLANFSSLNTTRHRFHFEADVETLVGEWDPARLEQVLTNLIENAVKYSPEGGEVCVTIKMEPIEEMGEGGSPCALIRVTDQGIGIPPDQQANLFELFYRAPNATAGHYGGLGVGLFISREIARQHGGDLQLEASSEQGTTFRLVLPLTRATLDSPQQVEESASLAS